jgi:hypothetical protein
MAPPKGRFFQRLIAPDFLGINWTKVTWFTPYNNVYPITMTSGPLWKYWSNPVGYGNNGNRMTRLQARMFVLGIPTGVLAFTLVFQPDWYQGLKILYYFPKKFIDCDIPEWAEKQHAEEMRHKSWYKPGAYAKHHYGGQISIPGSEANIK